jgi:tripartite-type tricarboxylate transporter receptor subunit TctC
LRESDHPWNIDGRNQENEGPVSRRAVQRAEFAIAAAVGVFALPCAAAEIWPSHPMTMVVPFAAGGSVDPTARVLAAGLSQVLGQQVIVQNVGGAGGMTGTDRVAKAAADGYQFVFGGSGIFAQNQTLYKHPLYRTLTDFSPVALVAQQPIVLVTRKDLPVRNLQDFMAYTRANQAQMQYGSAGTGSNVHLACVLLNAAIGVNVTHVPYRGGGPAMQDLIAGRIDYQCPVNVLAMSQIASRTVTPIAVLARDRSPSLPDLASAQEQGLAGFDASNWYAVALPSATPTAIVRKLNEAVVAAMNSPTVQEQMKKIGADLVEPERRSPEYLQEFLESEIVKWAKIIKASGIVLD